MRLFHCLIAKRRRGGGIVVTYSSLAINDVTVTEGVDTFATFTITRTVHTSRTETVDYATANISAISGTDYVATSGTISFLPTETTKTINVPIIADGGLNEVTETFSVALSNPTGGASISDGTGICIINDYGIHKSIAIPTYPYPSFANY